MQPSGGGRVWCYFYCPRAPGLPLTHSLPKPSAPNAALTAKHITAPTLGGPLLWCGQVQDSRLIPGLGDSPDDLF